LQKISTLQADGKPRHQYLIGHHGLFDELHRKGNTIIMVTHEEDIAGYAHRIVRLCDGLIESDSPNPHIKR
jgi:ABC-type ATPase involved in cell division